MAIGASVVFGGVALSALQPEGGLYAHQLLAEALVHAHALLHLLAAVYHGAVVAVAHELAYAAGRHLGVFLGEEHGHLASRHVVAPAALAVHLGGGDVVVGAHGLHDVVHGEGAVVGLHGAVDDALGQLHGDVAAVDDAVGQQSHDGSLYLADAAVVGAGHVLHHVLGNVEAVAAHLHAYDVGAELHVGLVQLGHQSAGEAGDEPLGHVLQLHGRTVAGQQYALAVAEEVVEDVEERVERLRLPLPLLYVVDEEHVYRLVEVDEVVGGVVEHGVGVLRLEEACADVEHPLLGVQLQGLQSDGVEQVGLSAARGAEDEHGVELEAVGVLGYAAAYVVAEFVALSLQVVVEVVLGLQVGGHFLGRGSVQHGGRLVGPGPGHLLDGVAGVGLYVL